MIQVHIVEECRYDAAQHDVARTSDPAYRVLYHAVELSGRRFGACLANTLVALSNLIVYHHLQALEKEAEQLQEQLPGMQQDAEKLSLEAQRKDEVRLPLSATASCLCMDRQCCRSVMLYGGTVCELHVLSHGILMTPEALCPHE